MPVNFLDSEIAREAILQCINNIEAVQASQQEVDIMYENVCNVYYKEMDLWFRSHNVNSVSKKKFRNISKPFWDDELSEWWKNLCKAEYEYLASRQNSRARRHLLNNFKQKQNIFDKSFRKAKCKFERDKRINIERLNTENPREFWKALNNLGPRKKNNIPMQVYDEEGNVTGEIDKVMSKWKSDFHNLFQGYDTNEFNTEFYNQVFNEKERLEAEGHNINTDTFNSVISLEETQKVLGRAKNNKVVGAENLPNEILKIICRVNCCILFLIRFLCYTLFHRSGNKQ
jgi:hypothetical protein